MWGRRKSITAEGLLLYALRVQVEQVVAERQQMIDEVYRLRDVVKTRDTTITKLRDGIKERDEKINRLEYAAGVAVS